MAENLAIACRCGKVRGHLREAGPREGDRYTCYCNDCRDFVRVLGHVDGLDDNGGVGVYQTRVGNLHLLVGAERLATLHMTDKPTMRWYASCCDTPFCNTAHRAKPAFLSVFTTCCDEARCDRVLGPAKGDVFPEQADPPLDDPDRVSMLKMAVGFLPRVLLDNWGHGWRRSPLFDAATKQPIATPRRVSPEERAALDAR